MAKKLEHKKVSTGLKAVLEGVANFFGVITAICLIGAFANGQMAEGILVAAVTGGMGAVVYWLSSLLAAKDQYTEK